MSDDEHRVLLEGINHFNGLFYRWKKPTNMSDDTIKRIQSVIMFMNGIKDVKLKKAYRKDLLHLWAVMEAFYKEETKPVTSPGYHHRKFTDEITRLLKNIDEVRSKQEQEQPSRLHKPSCNQQELTRLQMLVRELLNFGCRNNEIVDTLEMAMRSKTTQ